MRLSEYSLEQFDCLRVVHLEVLLEQLLDDALGKIKDIVPGPNSEVFQTVDDTLPQGVPLQYLQVLLHQLHLLVVLHVDQVPKVKQTQLLKATFPPFPRLMLVESVQDLP